MAIDQLYQQLILDHNREPRNHGPLPGATHSARGQDALCGDDILLELIVDNNCIREAAFSGEACAVTKATASMLTEWLAGRDRQTVAEGFGDFKQLLSDPKSAAYPELGEMNELRAVAAFPARVRNALLPWRTALKALG